MAAKRHGVGFLEGCNIPNENVVPIDVGLVCFILRFTMGKPPKLNHNSLAHHHDEALNPNPKFPPGLLGPYPPTLAGMAADSHSSDERGDQGMVNGVFYTTPGHQGLNDLLRDNFIINVYNNRY